jgi:hypothetical protein
VRGLALLTAMLAFAAGCRSGDGDEAVSNPYPDDPALVERTETPAQR